MCVARQGAGEARPTYLATWCETEYVLNPMLTILWPEDVCIQKVTIHWEWPMDNYNNGAEVLFERIADNDFTTISK